jgi:hypothetical protein
MVLATPSRSKAVGGAVDSCDLRSLIGDLERSIAEVAGSIGITRVKHVVVLYARLAASAATAMTVLAGRILTMKSVILP